MNNRIIREITPLTNEDFFVVLNNKNAMFDFPVHYHPEYELNLVLNSSGTRVVGDSKKEFSSPDLVLIGPNTPHAWKSSDEDAHVITIQFNIDYLEHSLLSKKLMTPLKVLLENARMGISFSKGLTQDTVDRIFSLTETRGVDSFFEFLSLIYDLSTSRNQARLSSISYVEQFDTSKSRRIKEVNKYLHENLQNTIKIEDVAKLVNMSPSAFSHFFKKRTQRSFTEYLTELRIGYAAKQLIESDKNISEICFESGFNNISNFNRTFKAQKGCTPSNFRIQQRFITIH
jgi:AraC-like DNA-binding protein